MSLAPPAGKIPQYQAGSRVLRRISCSKDFVPMAGLLVMTMVFFAPTLLAPGMFRGGDIEGYFLPYWTYVSDQLGLGRLPLWDPYSGLGVPLQSDMESGLFYPPNLLFRLITEYRTLIILVGLHVLLSGIFTYFFTTRRMNLSRLAGVTSATTVMFSGYVASQIGHINIIASGTWFLAVMLLFSSMLLARDVAGFLIYGLLAGGALALEILGQGSQIIYFGFIVLAILALCMTLPERRWARLLVSVPAVMLVGMLLVAVQLLPTAELTMLSVRGGGLSLDEAMAYSVEPLYLLLSWIMPSFFFSTLDGAGSAPFAQVMGYAGILALVAAVFGLWYGRRDRFFGFAVVIFVTSLFFALGRFNPMYQLLHDYLPGMGLLRVPGRWLFFTVLSLSLLAGLGIDALWLNRAASATVRFCKSVTVVVVATALGLEVVHAAAPRSSVLSDRANLLSPVALTFLVFAAISVGVVYGLAVLRKRRSMVALAAVVVVFADLLLFSSYLPFNWTMSWSLDPTLASLKTEGALSRVAKPTNWVSMALVPEHVYEIDSYATLNLARRERLREALPSNPEPLLDLLDVQYMLVSPGGAPEALTHSPPRGMSVVERSGFLPRAFVVHRSRSLPSSEILDEMLKPEFDPRQVVLVEGGPQLDHQPGVGGSAQIVQYQPESVRLRADLPEEGFLVLSDSYYPGWRAYVDGVESRIYQADYVLRAVYLSAGSHDLLFRFDPPLFRVGLWVSIAALFGFAGALVVLMRARGRMPRPDSG